MKKIFFISILTLCLASCGLDIRLLAPKGQAKKYASIKYTGKETDIDKRLDINGFYIKNDNRPVIPNDTSDRNCIMFFSDGTIIEFVINRENCRYLTSDSIKNNLYKYINEHRLYISRCGIYKLKEDIIYENSFYIPQYYWYMSTRKFKIASRNRISDIYQMWDRNISEDNKLCADKYMLIPIPEQSQPLKILHINHYLKKQKWLWENKKDWKKYIKSVSQNPFTLWNY